MACSTALAYAAGMLDGEGTITLYNRHGKGNWTKCLIQVANDNKETLDFIASTLGFGKVYEKHKTKSKEICYSYQIGSIEGRKALVLLYPYLIVKKKQADIMFEYWAILDGNKNTLDKARKASIDVLVEKIGILNHRKPKKRKLECGM